MNIYWASLSEPHISELSFALMLHALERYNNINSESVLLPRSLQAV